MSIRILGLAGSTRSGSLNKRLVRAALHHAEAGGADTTFLDLRSLEIPLYDGDLEAASGLPEGVRTLRAALAEADGILISSPEYNGSFSAVLKNALDWASRPDPDRPGEPSPWQGGVAALLSATPGGLGGIRGLIQLRTVLSGIGVHVVPRQLGVASAHEVVDESGVIEHERWRTGVAAVVEDLVDVATRLRGA